MRWPPAPPAQPQRATAAGAGRERSRLPAAALVVITEHGQVSHVVSEVIAQGGTIERSLPDLDTLVVNGISAATVRADDARALGQPRRHDERPLRRLGR